MKTRRIKEEDLLETKEPIIEQPKEETTIYSSGRSGDEEQENTGRVELKCNRCLAITSFTRMVPTRLLCPKCGSDNFLCLSNFRMESPEKEKTMRVGDDLLGGGIGSAIWKLV